MKKISVWIFITMTFIKAKKPLCVFPPFLGIESSSVAPHITLLIDASVSMGWSAVPGAENPWRSFEPDYTYYGSFDPEYYYKYDVNNKYFYKYREYNQGAPHFNRTEKLFSGNLLNYAQWLVRIQILKKVLTGEKIVSILNDGKAVAEIRKRGWEGGFASVVLSDSPLEILYFYFYDDGEDEGNVGKIGGTFHVSVWKQVSPDQWEEEKIIPRNPWRVMDEIENFEGLIRKFSDKDNDGFVDEGKPLWSVISFTTPSVRDPFPLVRVLARKENDISEIETGIENIQVIGLTSTRYGVDRAIEIHEEATRDPDEDLFYDIYCNLPQGIWCKKTYVILASDGRWNAGGDPLEAVWNSHITDLRSDLPEKQNITYFSLYMFETPDAEGGGTEGKNALQWIALWGGFKDVDNNNKPGNFLRLPVDSRTEEFSPPSNYDERDIAEWDRDANRIPDNYFEAPTGEGIEKALRIIFARIEKEVASGTGAPSFPISSTGEGLTFQAFFSPSRKNELDKDVFWLGYLNSLWVDEEGNLREDTDGDRKLNLIEDYIVRFKYDPVTKETYLELYQDVNGNSILDPSETTPVGVRKIYEIKGVLNFGNLLKERAWDKRRIKYVKKTSTGFTLEDFTSSNIPELQRLLDVSSLKQADTVIKYIRGKDFPFLRSRFMEGNVWKLGDIVNSTPVYISSPRERYDLLYGDPSYLKFYGKYKKERGIVITGANDGILHIFNAGVFVPENGNVNRGYLVNRLSNFSLGEEIMGIIPRGVLPHLKYLLRSEYEGCHIYYVDGRPYVTDVRIFPEDNVHPGGWGTILIQGLNFGGVPETLNSPFEIISSSYLVLDITDPANLNNIKVLTEFSTPRLGFTTSYPSIVKIEDTWYLAVGSGPFYLPEAYSDSPAVIYLIDLREPKNYYTLKIGEIAGMDSSFVGDLTSTDIMLRYSTDRIFFALNKYKPGSGSWESGIFMIKTNYEPDISNWEIHKIFTIPAPVTAELAPVVDERGNLWVLFGTGRFWVTEDFELQGQQYIVGFKVEENITKTIDELVDVTDAELVSNGMEDSIIAPFGRFSFSDFENLIASRGGWFIRLDESERCITRPAVIGGAAVFTTLNPLRNSNNECNPCESGQAGGSGRVFGLYVKTGTAHPISILNIKTDLGGGRFLIEREKEVSGLPSEPSLHIGKQRSSIFVQTTEGVIERYDINIPSPVKKGTVIWKKER